MAKASIGEFLKEQRRTAQLSLRQLADMAGVSNPYLSQIERGLRKPSADVLQQIAKALRISSEALYVRAGLLDEPIGSHGVSDAILADASLSEQQKRALLEVYLSFRAANVGADDGDARAPSNGAGAFPQPDSGGTGDVVGEADGAGDGSENIPTNDHDDER